MKFHPHRPQSGKAAEQKSPVEEQPRDTESDFSRTCALFGTWMKMLADTDKLRTHLRQMQKQDKQIIMQGKIGKLSYYPK